MSRRLLIVCFAIVGAALGQDVKLDDNRLPDIVLGGPSDRANVQAFVTSGKYVFPRLLKWEYDDATGKIKFNDEDEVRQDLAQINKAVIEHKLDSNVLSPYRPAQRSLTSTMYALDVYDQSRILIIDGASAALLGSIPLTRPNPVDLAIAPDNQAIYVLHGAGTPGLTIIDTARRQVTGTVDLPALIFPTQNHPLAMSPDGARLYIADRGDLASRAGAVHVYDITRRSVTGSVPAASADIRDAYTSVSLSPDGALLYASTSVNGIRVIDTATNAVSAVIRLSANHIVFHPRGTFAYVHAATRLNVINTATSSIIGSVPFGVSVSSLGISARGDVVFAWELPLVANGSAVIKAVETRTLRLAEDLPTDYITATTLLPVP